MGRKSYLAKNTLLFALGNFGTKFISFFLVPIYTKVLTTEDYGIVDLVSTIGIVLAPLIILNISESLMRFPLDKNADNEGILSVGIHIWFFSFPLTGILILLTSAIPIVSQYSIYIGLYTFALASSQLFLSYLRGKEKLLRYSIGNIINSLFVAVFNIFFLVVFRFGISGYLLAYVVANFITAIYAVFAGGVISDLKKYHIDKKLLKTMLKYSIVLAPNTFLWWITNSSDRIMVTAMISAAANGIYAVSYKIPTLLSTVAQIFNQAWSYSAIHENESADKTEYSNAIYNGLVGVSTIAASIMLLIIKPFLFVYVDHQYFEAWKYTPYLIIGFVFLSLGSFLATPYVVEKDSKGFLFSATFGAFVNIIFNFVLIPVIGVSGAALSTCISYIAVVVYRVIDTRKYIIIRVLNLKHLICYTALIFSSVFLYFQGILFIIIQCLMLIIIVYSFRDVLLQVWGTVKNKIHKKKH